MSLTLSRRRVVSLTHSLVREVMSLGLSPQRARPGGVGTGTLASARGEAPGKAERKDHGEGVGKGRAEAGQHWQQVAADAMEQRRAEHDCDAGKTGEHAGNAAWRHALVRGQQMGDDDAAQ